MFIQSRSAGFKHCYNDKQYIYLSGLTPREILEIKQSTNCKLNMQILEETFLVTG